MDHVYALVDRAYVSYWIFELNFDNQNCFIGYREQNTIENTLFLVEFSVMDKNKFCSCLELARPKFVILSLRGVK